MCVYFFRLAVGTSDSELAISLGTYGMFISLKRVMMWYSKFAPALKMNKKNKIPNVRKIVHHLEKCLVAAYS